jgi:L-threonylcarbamoyladenylate synthase
MSVLDDAVRGAAQTLAEGRLVAFPTETVYGLGADASDPSAVAKIFSAKGRPADHPLIVHLLPDVDLTRWAVDIPPVARALAAAFWPGPLTLILKRSDDIPLAVTGGQDTVGLRSPSHPVALALLRAFAVAGSGIIAAPSANKFGHISPTSAAHVRDEFADAIGRDIVLIDGEALGTECDVGIESTIVDLSSVPQRLPKVLRPGHITRSQLNAVLAPFGLHLDDGKDQVTSPRVSGALAAHYAPRTPMRLVSAQDLSLQLSSVLSGGKRAAVFAQTKPPALSVEFFVPASSDPKRYAHDLYAALHVLDAMGVDLILVEAPSAGDDWEAVRDRLGRAEVGAGAATDRSV